MSKQSASSDATSGFVPREPDHLADLKASLLRGALEGHVLEFFREPEHKGLLKTIREAYHDDASGPEIAGQMLRMTVLWSVTPEHGFPLQQGPRLGLLCRMLETAIGLVEWDSVARELTVLHNEGGK